MSLNEWLAEGWLTRHRPDKREISELLGIAERAITDAGIKEISPDARLSIAHNAALQLATAALAATGYRAGHEAYHFRTLRSLTFTIEAETDIIDQLDVFRKKRNISDYERAGAISNREAEEMLALAKTLREAVISWLKSHHPQLLP
jgi:HEPN domain-containing protein